MQMYAGGDAYWPLKVTMLPYIEKGHKDDWWAEAALL